MEEETAGKIRQRKGWKEKLVFLNNLGILILPIGRIFLYIKLL